MSLTYVNFLKRKVVVAPQLGFDVDGDALSPRLKPFQRDIVRWALKAGRAAIFADTGLGKTLMQLEWSRQVLANEGGGRALILCPLAVASQTQREGEKFGIPVNHCATGADVVDGINVLNYARLDEVDASSFVAVVLDESSILKNYTGATKRALCAAFEGTRFKLCCTATPAPNDHMELGNHAQFLEAMGSNEMLARWFQNDPMEAGKYDLKPHAEADFWRWVHSWAVSVGLPSDIGHSDEGYVLPPLEVLTHVVEDDRGPVDGKLFDTSALSATNLHKTMRATAPARAAKVAELVAAATGPFIAWCNTDYEAAELMARIPGAVEVSGSMSATEKERRLLAFADGEIRVLVSKPSLAGLGLNFQVCAEMAFVGLSYSYEQLYQAIRRAWRFGQTRTVVAHVIHADSEGSVLTAIQRKQAEHERMKVAMRAAVKAQQLGQLARAGRPAAGATTIERGEGWEMRHADCVAELGTLADASVDLSVFSPPFANLYVYSDGLEDMGNSADEREFAEHFRFMVRELHRVTVPGRIAAVHCKDLPRYANTHGSAGLYDFPGDIVRVFESEGWQFHSRVTIWKCPVTEMQRTKNHGLLYKQLRKDSSASRMGMADYVLAFRKWTDGEDGWPKPVTHEKADFPLDRWQQWASPVWMDISQTRVLKSFRDATAEGDTKHICPLQLDVVERCVTLWSNPGDLVLSPFAGVGSEGVESLRLGRRFLGIELKAEYFRAACGHLRAATVGQSQGLLFGADDAQPVGATEGES